MNEETNLPEGLQLAVKLLAQIGDDDSDRAIAAVHAVMDPGQPGELPEGLQLAVKLLEGDRDDFVSSQLTSAGLSALDEKLSDGYLRAQGAIRSEHHQRLTLQHHIADQAQRIAELEAIVNAPRGTYAQILKEREIAAAKEHLLQCMQLTPPTAAAMAARPCRCSPDGCSVGDCAGKA